MRRKSVGNGAKCTANCLEPAVEHLILSNRSSPDAATNANVQSLFEAAVAASLRGESDVSVALLDELLRLDPQHARALHLRGAEYAQAGNTEQALTALANSLALDPNQVVARFQFGLLLLVEKRLADAIAVWEPLQALGERHPFNVFRLGTLQFANGQFGEARETLASLLVDSATMPVLQRDTHTLLEAIAKAAAQATGGGPDATAAISEEFVLAAYERMQRLH